MRAFGYYVVKPLPAPGWCGLGAESILSVSENGLSEKFPDLERCFYINKPRKLREEYRRYLCLDEKGFDGFCGMTAQLFDSRRLTTDMRFRSAEDAFALCALVHLQGHKVVGIYTDDEIFSEYEREGTFDLIGTAEDTSRPKRLLGCDILGCEALDTGYFCFDTYIINSLYEEIAEQGGNLITDRHTALIQNPYNDTKEFCGMIQGQGEPVIWTPFEVYEIE